jgi:hypothetical protein
MQKYLMAGVLAMALAAPAFAQDNMSGPAQPGAMASPAQTGSGMAGGMHHGTMGKKKPKKPMKHDAMGGSMSGPAQTGNNGMAGGMSSPATH